MPYVLYYPDVALSVQCRENENTNSRGFESFVTHLHQLCTGSRFQFTTREVTPLWMYHTYGLTRCDISLPSQLTSAIGESITTVDRML